MNSWNRRIALASALACLAAPALAAEPARDCTVCKDPMWPTLENPMPGIPLYSPASPADPTAIQVNGSGLADANRSNGVGVPETAFAQGSVHSDPLWPQVRTTSGGMAATATAAPAPRPAPAAKPATSQAAGPVAAR
jgi:hypothetical protein